jgi:cytochrome c
VWKDSYVFLMNMDGKMLAHPFQPELTQQPHLLLMTDPTDKALFVHFVNLARTVGHGWVEYMWPKPGKSTPSKKLTYIYRVPNQDVFVGAGVYVGGMVY